MIKSLPGEIIDFRDLSKTAREIVISIPEPLFCPPGSFVNVFIEIDGEKVRRAFSVVSQNDDFTLITLAIRNKPGGKMTPFFWREGILGTALTVMGPLGLNTADKMTHKNIYLFGFGIGAGVVKSLAEHFSQKDDIERLVIMTGSRTEDEILYKDYFVTLGEQSEFVTFACAVSRPGLGSREISGYIQDHIGEFDFSDSDVYICGQESACSELVSKIKETNPDDCNFLIEAFH